MIIKYSDFIHSIIIVDGERYNYFYPIEVLELRSMTSFGIGFKVLMDRFIKKSGIDIEERYYWKNKSKVYPEEFVQLNRMMVEKMYNTNAQATYNMSTNEYIDYYGKLGQELIVEI